MRISNSLKIVIKKPTLQTALLQMWFCELFLLTMTRYVLARLGIFEGLTRSLVLVIVSSFPIIYFLLNINKIEQRKYISFFVIYIAIISSLIFTAISNPLLVEYLTRPGYGLDRLLRPDCALYALLFFGLFDEPKELKRNMKIYAYLYFVYLLVVQLIPALMRGYWIDIGSRGQELKLSYSLSFGYSMLFPTIMCLYLYIRDKNKFALIISLIGLWSIFTNGNRGAILMPVIFIGLMVISYIIESKDMTSKTFKISVVSIFVFCVMVFGDAFLVLIVNYLSQLGIESRSLNLLLKGEFANDNGRTLIWMTVINAIRDGGILGYGVYGDRLFVTPIHYVGYAHNIFLELIISFGIIGALISLYIIVDAIRMIFFCKNREWRELYMILFAISCQLLLSMSFWYVWEFWAAAAVAYKYRLNKNTCY